MRMVASIEHTGVPANGNGTGEQKIKIKMHKTHTHTHNVCTFKTSRSALWLIHYVRICVNWGKVGLVGDVIEPRPVAIF